MVDARYNGHFGPHEKVVIMEVFENIYLFLSVTVYIYIFCLKKLHMGPDIHIKFFFFKLLDKKV